MKNKVSNTKGIIIACVLLVVAISANCQIKVTSNGYVGIGSASTPSYNLDINGALTTTHYSSSSPFQISHYGLDPRLQSNRKIVFYNINSSGYIDIECKTLYQSSDSSLKENITSIKGQGLDKILKLNPVSYSWKNSDNRKGGNSKKEYGFIAQEVEKVMPDIVYTIDSTNQKLLSYTQIIPYLTEAISELNDKIVVLEEELKNGNTNTNKSASIDNNSGVNEDMDFDAKLFQNAPNPFNTSTTVNYKIPADCMAATINIFDMKGTPIKHFELTTKGESNIIINAAELKAGMYIYALIVNGKIIDSKNMILTD